MEIRAILTGATGMVGEGVLNECLQHPDVKEVLVVVRRPTGMSHPKLKEIVHPDFHYLTSIESQLKGYNACFFCLGVSSVGMTKDDYYKQTYLLTLNFATTLVNQNSDMVFCYISGAGTDSSEKGRLNWARVKGKTENDLNKLPFRGVYHFRPGLIAPTKGLRNTLKLYTYLGWLIPVIRFFSPTSIVSLKQLGLAMINAARLGYEKKILEIRDILELSKR